MTGHSSKQQMGQELQDELSSKAWPCSLKMQEDWALPFVGAPRSLLPAQPRPPDCWCQPRGHLAAGSGCYPAANISQEASATCAEGSIYHEACFHSCSTRPAYNVRAAEAGAGHKIIPALSVWPLSSLHLWWPCGRDARPAYIHTGQDQTCRMMATRTA
jgi:hypothetical protein